MEIIKKLTKAKRQKFLVDWLCNCIYIKFSDVFHERIDSCPLGTVCIYPKDLSIKLDSFIKFYINKNEDLHVSYCMVLATRKFHNRIEALEKWLQHCLNKSQLTAFSFNNRFDHFKKNCDPVIGTQIAVLIKGILQDIAKNIDICIIRRFIVTFDQVSIKALEREFALSSFYLVLNGFDFRFESL